MLIIMLPISKPPEQDSIKVPRRNNEDICRDLTHSPFRLGKLHSMVRARPHVYIFTYFETPTSSFWDNIVVSCESTIVSPFCLSLYLEHFWSLGLGDPHTLNSPFSILRSRPNSGLILGTFKKRRALIYLASVYKELRDSIFNLFSKPQSAPPMLRK